MDFITAKRNKILLETLTFKKRPPKGGLSLTGFTLLELLISVAILVVAILATAQTLGVISTNRAFGYHINVASNLAQNKLEEFKIAPYGNVSPGADASAIDEIGNSGGIYSRSWNVVTDSPISGVKTVTVTVTWPPSSSTTNSVSLWTIKGQ